METQERNLAQALKLVEAKIIAECEIRTWLRNARELDEDSVYSYPFKRWLDRKETHTRG